MQSSVIDASALFRAVQDLGPSPCQGCGFYESCAKRDLACLAYEQFVDGKSQAAWSVTLRWQEEVRTLPTRDSYQRVFTGPHSPKPANRPGRPVKFY